MRHRLAALVLAGGRSRRLGRRDKALIEVGGHTMLDRVLATMIGAGAGTVIVVGPDRQVTAPGVVFTSEEQPGGGPVPAVAAGLVHAGSADLVVVCPVDVPLLGAEDVTRLINALDSAPDLDAVAAADHRGRANPLLAAYRCSTLAARLPLALSDPGAAAARLLDGASVLVIDLGDAATNVNSPADLSAARRLAGPKG